MSSSLISADGRISCTGDGGVAGEVSDWWRAKIEEKMAESQVKFTPPVNAREYVSREPFGDAERLFFWRRNCVAIRMW